MVQSAKAAAMLYKFDPPFPFASMWMLRRAFGSGKGAAALGTVASRRVCKVLLVDLVQETFGRLRCGMADGEESPVLGTRLSAIELSLRKLVPRILPRSSCKSQEVATYRLVLDNGDFGIHNMTVLGEGEGAPHVTSVFDWEEGCIVPALLSQPMMIVTADLILTENGEPGIRRWGDGDTPSKMAEYMTWARTYYEVSKGAAETAAGFQKGGC